jgi:hypothetical protein
LIEEKLHFCTGCIGCSSTSKPLFEEEAEFKQEGGMGAEVEAYLVDERVELDVLLEEGSEVAVDSKPAK